MAKKQNLSAFESPLPSAEGMKFGIVVSEWNDEVTDALLAGALKTLREAGCMEHNIVIRRVPGAFELSLGAQFFAEYSEVDGVIALGCVIRGGTPHFEYVCQAATQGINQVMIAWNMPIAFGLLTCDDHQQAMDRAGGKHGNKGDEAAAAAIKMIALQNEMEAEADSDKHDRRKVN
jgi:6,7-dimethyl-8-ribityllumazine synthase